MTAVFEVVKESGKSKARAGVIHTNHGPVPTPVFMPVGTQATVKTLTPAMLEDIGADIILSNTYHLSLRPGIELIREFSGLHPFMNWQRPILTDSGGYQVFSLAGMRKITDDGVTFKSHLDGSSRLFTPENVVDLQLGFNSDILMPLDICTPYPSDKETTRKDLQITAKWEERAAAHWRKNAQGQLLFGIVQGGMFPELRKESADQITALDLPGYAMGGLSVGEPREQMEEMVSFTTSLLPKTKPRYLMGVGLPENLSFAIDQGVDMFDCVIPTRLARHGQVFSDGKRINIRNQQYRTDKSPIDATCACYTCRHFSKAYLRHLFAADEILGLTLMSLHNVHYLVHFVKAIRQAILDE